MPSASPRTIAPAATDLADRTRHNTALRLLPFLFVLYIVNYLDRTSVAYAALGMSRELGFSDRVVGLGIGVFFISYVALQIPGALLVERWSARRVISATMIAWGSLTSLTALVHTPSQLYVARFLLGAAEAAFFPGVLVYLTHWFSREDRAKATANFMGAIPLSFVIGSPIAGWILGHKWFAIEGWRWLFVLEGMPAVVLGAAAFFYLTDWPREARWLAPEHREWLEQKLREEKSCKVEMAIWKAIRSKPVVLMCSATFLAYAANYAVVFWLPTMLKRMSGFSDMRVGLFGALPYIAAFLAMQLNAWHSDKRRERRWHSAIMLFVGGAGLLGLMAHPHSITLVLVLFSAACMSVAYLPTFWAIPTEMLGQSAAAAAVGSINAIGSVAGFAGPYLFGYMNTRTGSFSVGLAIMTAAIVAGGMLIFVIPRRFKQTE